MRQTVQNCCVFHDKMSNFDEDDNEMNIDAIHDIQAVYLMEDKVANDALDYEDDQTNTIEENDIISVNNEVVNNALDYEDDQTNTIEENDIISVNNEVVNNALDYEDDQTNTIEDDNIFVNNEVAHDAVDSGDDETNSILQKNLTWAPIVYTTRLDEMNIFDKIEKYTPKEAAVLIQYESKPQYKQMLPIKRESYDFHSYSFMKLYSDIERLNQKVQTETKLRNEELMSMCKPLKIVLKDIKYDEVKTTDSGSKNFNQINRKPRNIPSIQKILAKPKMAEKGQVKSVAKFQKLISIKIDDSDESDSSDDMPLKMLKPSVIDSIQILPGTTTLSFIDKTSMKADIYIINYSKDLRCSYETNSEKFNLMKNSNPTKNTVVYDICCWVKREKQIKLLSQSGVANEDAICFMRIPHGCLPASCTCCCILEPPIPTQSSVKFLKMSNKISDTNTEASKLIQKAYSFRPKLQSSKIYAVDEPKSFLKNAVIMMKYKDILFSQSYDLGENYEIGMEGDIENHVKLTVNRSMTEERELFEKHDRENEICRQYFLCLICCWYKREEIIINMSKDHNLLPRAIQYLRNPHLCKSHKCQCCCQQAKSGLLLDNKIIAMIPQSKKHSKGIREDKKKNQVAMDKSQAKIKKVYIDNQKKKGKTVPPGNTVAIGEKNKQNSIAVMVSHCKPRTVETISQTVVETSIKSQPNVAITIEQPRVPAELIKSIYDKFKELKLSVNVNGKLTANINTPPEKLLPVEIKVLADILAQASNQMHELGIEPEEFCRRVNSKSLFINTAPSTGIPSISLPPKLPLTTQPSSLLAQESILPPPLCPIVKKTKENTQDISQPLKVSKRHKQKSQPCKTTQFCIKFPRTTNNGKIANLYSMMSHTGWIRNKCMTAAYNIHFDLEIDEEPEPQLTNVQEQPLPKIVKVQSLVDTAPNTNITSNRFKRKQKQADIPESKGESCKRKQKQADIPESKGESCKRKQKQADIPETKGESCKRKQNQADKPESKGESSKIRVLPPERISTLPINMLPLSTQMNMIGLANLATLTQNFVKPIEPILGHSQENLFDRNNFIPIQYFNGNLASSFPNAGNNVVLAQGINSGVPTMHIPDSGKIWAYVDGKLVELQRVAPNSLPNAASQDNIAFNQNYGIPQTVTMNQTPMITVNNGIPMQVSRLCADTEHKEDAKAPTANVETQESVMNSLLRDMLSKESTLPSLPQPKHRYANAPKRTVTPLILAHSKTLENKKKRRRVLDVTNLASKENLHDDVTESSIEIIVSDEEEESIFGV